MSSDTIKSILTISCKDGTKRVITVLGLWTTSTAAVLAQDLEKDNYQSVTVTH